MTTKHTPATPYITTSCDAEFQANADEGRKYRAEQDRRANAYQQLVEALRDCAEWLCEAHQGSDQWERGHAARALLSELGESK